MVDQLYRPGRGRPAIQSLLAQGERRQTESHLSVRERRKKAKERAQIERRRAFRVTYDLPPPSATGSPSWPRRADIPPANWLLSCCSKH